MSTAYYNEFDKFAAEWLRELIKAGLIAPGIVDDRSIEDVTPNDLRGFTQHHFFAGIGVWSYALRSAGWPDDRQVWTASCPCQPFSTAGKGAGFTDERHLWPTLHHLVQECRPPVIVGEQVASKDAGPWIDLIHSDLEALGYAFGCVPFPSAGVGAPHIRDRAYWVAGTLANNNNTGLEGRGQPGRECLIELPAWEGGVVGRLEHARHDDDAGESNATGVGHPQTNRPADQPGGSSISLGGVANLPGSGRREECADTGGRAVGDGAQGVAAGFVHGIGAGSVADTDQHGRSAQPLPRLPNAKHNAESCGSAGGLGKPESERHYGRGTVGPAGGRLQSPTAVAGLRGDLRPGPVNGFWRAADWVFCRDGKWRPVEPCTFPLAHGAPARVGRLRGYGNAVNAKAAQVFIESLMK